MDKFTLITPNEEIVKKYNDFWFKRDNSDWSVHLFKNPEIRIKDIRNHIGNNPYEMFGAKDKKIEKAWKDENVNVISFLRQINSVYNTRVRNIGKPQAEKTLNDIDKNKLSNMEFTDFVKLCKKFSGSYAYSFATKVYSFMKPEEYPIVDSLVATLLEYYLKAKGLDREYPKSKWGDYDEYIKAYNRLKKEYNLHCSNKQIDVFLWTYAIAIQDYWEKMGVLSFAPVTYKGTKS